MPFRGPRGRLKGLADGLRHIGRRGIDHAVKEVRAEAEALYEAQFRSRSGPWGRSWGRSLFKTGALANPYLTGASGRVRIRLEKYWVYQQIGARGMRPAALLPFTHGSKWDARIEAAINRGVGIHRIR